MKKILLINIIMLIFSITPTQLFAQNKEILSKINANVEFGRNYSNCRQPGSFCEFTIKNNTSNTQIHFNKEHNELVLVFSKTNLDATNKNKLLSNELEKDFYLYTFDEDFILPLEIKNALNIKNLSKIKQGDYLVKVIKDQIIIKLQLE